MNYRTKVLVPVVVGAGLFLNAALIQSQASNGFAKFRIHIALNDERNGVEMKCDEGCAWKTLTFSCGNSEQCQSWIDPNGMTGE